MGLRTMCKLKELAADYTAAAVKLNIGIKRLQRELAECDDPIETGRKRAELELVRSMLAEVREVGDVCRHYYDKGYQCPGKFTV